MRKMTESNLQAAFAGESQAHMKYLHFARKAEEEGFKNVARLFRAVAFAEEAHAGNHFKTLGYLGSTSENLQDAMNGENFEVEEMYPAYDAVAKLQDEKNAVRVIHWALEAEKVHAGLYAQAKQAVDSGKDVELGDIYICSVCGWTVVGEPPEKCPLCGSAQKVFVKF